MRLLTRLSMFAALALSACSGPAFASDALQLEKSFLTPGGLWQLWSRAGASDVTITGVVVDGGRCKPWALPEPPADLPRVLKSGEQRLLANYLCDPTDVVVATNSGDKSFRLDDDALAVEKSLVSPGGIWQLWSRAGAGDVTISSLVVNGGRCKPWRLPDPPAELPRLLKSGEKRLLANYLCDPTDVLVGTGSGEKSYRLDDEFTQPELGLMKSDGIEPGQIWELRFSARVDGETIERVVVNDGDCRPHAPPALPRAIGYGEALGDFVYFCEPTEVTVTTNLGAATFDLGQRRAGL